jgi:hypothetical protein
MDEKFLKILNAVFAMMTNEKQQTVPLELNPLLRSLEKKARRFRRDVVYYDFGDPIEFNQAYSIVKSDVFDVSKLQVFQKKLVDFMAVNYHVNSYVQESLVDMYRTVDDVMIRLRPSCVNDEVSSLAEHLFYQISSFEGRLEQSLQRGPVRWGFVKVRSFWHWDIVVVVRYFYDLLWRVFWCCESSSHTATSCRIAPIEVETAWLVNRTKNLDAVAFASAHQRDPPHYLGREILDIENLYWATRESDVASLIFVSACLTFMTSLVFTGARILNVGAVTQLVFLSAAVSSVGALLAIFHLVRKSIILGRLWTTLWYKQHNVRCVDLASDDMETATSHRLRYLNDVQSLKRVTMTQLLLTLARFGTVCAASTAFCLSLVSNVVQDQNLFPKKLPFWIAMGALMTAIGSVLFFFVVEYIVRYRLPTQLGPFVCSLFQDEIEECFEAMKLISSSPNRVDSQQVQDVVTWEYTSRTFLRKYRFDTVLAADRFGQILQYLQSNGYGSQSPTEKMLFEQKGKDRRFSI